MFLTHLDQIRRNAWKVSWMLLSMIALSLPTYGQNMDLLEPQKSPNDLFHPQSSLFDSDGRRMLKELERQSQEKREKFKQRLQQIRRERRELLRVCQCSSWDELIPIRKKSTFVAQAKVTNGWIDRETLESFQFSPELESFQPFQLQWDLQDSNTQLKNDFQKDLNSIDSEDPVGLAQGYVEAVLRRVAADYFPESRRPLRSLLDWMRESKSYKSSADISEDQLTAGNPFVIQDVKFQSAWVDAKKMKLNISLLAEEPHSNPLKSAVHEINIERQQCVKKGFDDCQNKTTMWISRKKGDSKVQISYELNRQDPSENHADLTVQQDF